MDGWWEVGEGAVADHLCFTFFYITKVNRAMEKDKSDGSRDGGRRGDGEALLVSI